MDKIFFTLTAAILLTFGFQSIRCSSRETVVNDIAAAIVGEKVRTLNKVCSEYVVSLQELNVHVPDLFSRVTHGYFFDKELSVQNVTERLISWCLCQRCCEDFKVLLTAIDVWMDLREDMTEILPSAISDTESRDIAIAVENALYLANSSCNKSPDLDFFCRHRAELKNAITQICVKSEEEQKSDSSVVPHLPDTGWGYSEESVKEDFENPHDVIQNDWNGPGMASKELNNFYGKDNTAK